MAGEVVGGLGRIRPQTEFANRLLPADRGARHLAVQAKQIDGQRNLAHLRRPPHPVGHHPLQHIGRALLPVEAGISVIEGIEHGLNDACFSPRQHAFADERLKPLHHDGADHLDCRGGADRAVVDCRRHAERHESRRRRFDMRAADQERGPVQARMDRRHHRDVDIAAARGLDVMSGARLGLRRAGIAVEKERAFGETWQSRHRRFVRLVGGDDGKDGLGARHRLGRGRSAKHFRRRIVRSLRSPHFGIGRIGLDVVGANARLEVRIGAPAIEKGMRGFAEAQKGDRARTYC